MATRVLKAGAIGASQLRDIPDMARGERINLARHGVSTSLVVDLANAMGMREVVLAESIGVSRPTFNRKQANDQVLSSEGSAAAIFLARLIAQVRDIVKQSGHEDRFDAGLWTAEWLQTANAAIDGQKPIELITVPEGQGVILQLIGSMQSGAYA